LQTATLCATRIKKIRCGGRAHFSLMPLTSPRTAAPPTARSLLHPCPPSHLAVLHLLHRTSGKNNAGLRTAGRSSSTPAAARGEPRAQTGGGGTPPTAQPLPWPGGWSSLMAAASQANKGGAPRRRPPPPMEPPTWPGAGGAPSQPVSRPGQATRPGAGLLHQERSSLRGDAEPRPRSTVASGQRVDRSATRPLPQGRCPLMF
jgi:hypothetical protein